MNKRNALKQLGLAALVALTLTGLSGCTDKKPSFASIDVTGADYAKDFTLSDHNGAVRHLADFKGKVVVLFFGYTQCPDVCPTTMAELAEIKKALGKNGDRLQGLFVTLDPERDTAKVLKPYMENFDPSFLALRPSLEQLPVVAKDFKIYYKKVEGRTESSYTMDHSAGSYVYDTQGRLRLFTRYGSPVEGLQRDISTLLGES